MDASNLLKPALARGELHCVGATTLDEYRKHIEKDAALERRFQPVFVGEPSVEDTIAILRGLKERYEVHHGIRIKDAALVAAADAVEPLHRRPQAARQGDRPDRRGGLAPAHGDRLDAGRARRARRAACASSRSSAQALAQGDRRRHARSGCGGSTRSSSAARRDGRARGALAEGEGGASRKIRELKAERERIKIEEQKAERTGDLATVAELRYGQLLAARARARAGERAARPRSSSSAACSRRRSTRRTSPRWWPSGPASRSRGCSRARSRSWCRWRSGCTQRVVGQDEAVRAGVRGGAPRARRAAGPEPPDRLVPVPRADRRGQDRAGARARASSCSTTSTRWCASTCPSTRRSTRSRA